MPTIRVGYTHCRDWDFVALKHEPDSKLNLPRIRALRQTGNASYVRHNRLAGIKREICVCGRVPVLNIENIESFRSQLKFPIFTDWETLKERKIHIEHGRTSEGVASKTAERSAWDTECARVNPTGNCPNLVGCSSAPGNRPLTIRIGIGCDRPGRERISNQVWTQVIAWRIWRSASQIRQVTSNLQIKGSTTARLKNKIG